MKSPFDEERKGAEKARAAMKAQERAHVRALLANPSGRWLLREIMRLGDVMGEAEPAFNNRDYRAMGKRRLALDVAKMVREHGSDADIAEIIVGRKEESNG